MALAVYRTQSICAGTGGSVLKTTETQSVADSPIHATDLEEIIRKIFNAAGSDDSEAAIVANHLVEANLAGHDSHGVIRTAAYLDCVKKGAVLPNRHAQVTSDRGNILSIDGEFGYGQVIARESMEIAIERAKREGLVILSIVNAGHLGRIGAWAEQLAGAGLVSLHFVNTSGHGILVAPHGGRDRRLSTNPIAAGAPMPGQSPMILDIATSVIAEGKIMVARDRGDTLPEACFVDADGNPSRDPNAFYADPPGAILPFGGHKGFGIAVFCEVLAGALTGGASSHPSNKTVKRMANNMMTIALDPDAFAGSAFFEADISRLVGWIKSSRPSVSEGQVLIPGEVEVRVRQQRLNSGIPLDQKTTEMLRERTRGFGISHSSLLGQR
jgi:hydroxycarboxylate dehydrogenase B